MTILPTYLDSFDKANQQPNTEVVAVAGYSSERSYKLLKQKGITSYVKPCYFYQE